MRSSDSKRVGQALIDAGFRTRIVLDADRKAFGAALEGFANNKEADVALIYTTGHGVEHGGEIHLLMGDFPVAKGEAALAAHAVKLKVIAAAARAKKSNLVFYPAVAKTV